jgi:hypothetical protein
VKNCRNGERRAGRKAAWHMDKKAILTKVLAVAGTALAWFPILAPILLSMATLIRERVFRLDWLMPAELFGAVLAGGGLLLWAAVRAHARVKFIAWNLGVAVAVLIAGQALAVLSGLAHGETEPAGLWWALVLASIAVYSAAVVAVGVGGALLLRDLFNRPEPPGAGG